MLTYFEQPRAAMQLQRNIRDCKNVPISAICKRTPSPFSTMQCMQKRTTTPTPAAHRSSTNRQSNNTRPANPVSSQTTVIKSPSQCRAAHMRAAQLRAAQRRPAQRRAAQRRAAQRQAAQRRAAERWAARIILASCIQIHQHDLHLISQIRTPSPNAAQPMVSKSVSKQTQPANHRQNQLRRASRLACLIVSK